jgi:predicted exporter
MLLRPEGVAAAAHIIGYKLPIRLLPKLDLRRSRAATRPLSVAKALARFEVHENIFDAAGYRREDLKSPTNNLSVSDKFPRISTSVRLSGFHLLTERSEVTGSVGSTLHQLQGNLQL